MAKNSHQEQVAYRASANIVKLLAENQYKRRTGPPVELIKNSLDAGARQIDLHLHTGASSPKIVLLDDGIGMDEKGVQDFYSIGGSPKRGKKVNPLGHPLIGKYGVGNLGIYALGARHELETTHGGIVRTVSVNFDELEARGEGWLSHMHAISRREDRRRKSGTRIEINQLREKYANGFGKLESDLRRALGRELKGHLRYAAININGILVASYIEDLLKGTEPRDISFNVEDPSTGKKYRAGGTLWVLERSLDPVDSGIFPIINDANPILDGHLYGTMPQAWGKFRHRIYGEVNADFLEERLDLTRDGFIDVRDDPLLIAYHRELNKVLRGILQEQEQLKEARQSEEEARLLGMWSAMGNVFFNNLGGLEQKVYVVDPTIGGDDRGKKQRKWNPRGGSSTNSPRDSSPRVEPPDEGRMMETGGRQLSMRYVDEEGLPIVSIDDAGVSSEVLINRGHPLYEAATRSGDQTALRFVIEPQLMGALAAYRLSLDGELDFEAVRDLTDAKLSELGQFWKKEAKPLLEE